MNYLTELITLSVAGVLKDLEVEVAYRHEEAEYGRIEHVRIEGIQATDENGDKQDLRCWFSPAELRQWEKRILQGLKRREYA